MRRDSAMFRREAECHGDLEFGQSVHLAIEPIKGVGTEAVGPGQSRSEMCHAKAAHPNRGLVQTMIFVMKPLAESEVTRVLPELVQCGLWRAIFPQQPHVEMPVVGGAFSFLVPGRRLPGGGQVVEAVPVDPRRAANQELGGARQAPSLDLFSTE